ncbi:gp54 protein [Mycobacteroides abscessus subsp. massiliense]|uniref:phage antirepressor KilAC domain-containing protein n=1 Tax=Mycobacteroides abscessus TaxID=36809 RepID=UPI0009D1C49A|nr:phage antirepressor KilAC domain-containing protein [Mycobacteroides abscessus]SKM38315.1 gp54 protein [Mycobacteroides abscessus subsp. massiliense]SKW05288.1 gp54 protein [Mycobacteroides abscessus subsp. abscessus]
MARILQRPELPAHLTDLMGDYPVSEAARLLSVDPAINIGRDQLFEAMANEDWITRGRDQRWHAYPESVTLGYIALRPGGEYETPAGVTKERPQIIHVTAAGIGEMHYRLGGSQQLALT